MSWIKEAVKRYISLRSEEYKLENRPGPAPDEPEHDKYPQGKLLIDYTASDCFYTWDESKPFTISTLNYASGARGPLRDDGGVFNPHQPVGITVMLDRPLRAYTIIPNDFYEQTGLHALALSNIKRNCVVAQIAVCARRRIHRGRDEGMTWEPMFDDISIVEKQMDIAFRDAGYKEGEGVFAEGDWRSVGVTARMLKAFCDRTGIDCWIMHGRNLFAKWEPQGNRKLKHRPIIVLNIWGDHAFFYDATTPRVALQSTALRK